MKRSSTMARTSRPAVLITAGTRRLGLAFAAECLAVGLDVVLHYRSSNEQARQCFSRNPRLRDRVHYLQADLTDTPADALVREAKRMAPGLCGLVNNASVFAQGGLSDPAHFRATLEVNAIVPLALADAFRRTVRKGWIVNITDAHTGGNNLSYQNYRLSKRMLDELTRQLALAYAPAIRVNALAPGAVLPAPGASLREFRALSRTIPMRRAVNLDALVNGLSFLIGNESVTGQVLYIDGGWHLLG
jgi:NAD(P)-dependent dehydrogenase (short-subunit alcohol dehydrogenase family)